MSQEAEPRDRAALGRLQAEKLARLAATVLPRNPFWRRKFSDAGVAPGDLRGPDDLGRLPFTTKEELAQDQAAHPPYGTNLTYPIERYVRLHQTSGTKGRPMRWLDDRESWEWILGCWGRIYDTVGVSAGDRLLFAFSFGPFLGFWAAFDGAQRQGYFCLASGGLSTAARLRFLLENEATVVCCTPTYALRLAEAAEAEGLDLNAGRVRALVVAGEPGAGIPATRERLETAWGARLFDHYGMTEIGSLGVECREQPGGFHLLETECVAEVVDPVSGASVPPGREGELVLTNLGRAGSPLFRYRTGDRVVVDPAPCPCGRPSARLKGGILGRADDMLIVRGTNVYPSAVEAVVRRFPEILEFRIVLRGSDWRLEVEPRPGPAAPDLADRLAEAVKAELLVRPDVALLPFGSLPRGEMKSQRVLRVV
jgi:phenylacetate-CoA ligase